MEVDTNYTIITPPRSLTARRGLKRAAELEELQRSHVPHLEAPRRVPGMFSTITTGIWSFGANVVHGFLDLFNCRNTFPHAPEAVQPTHIDAISTDHSGRKRRAVEVTPPTNEQTTHPLYQTFPQPILRASPQPTEHSSRNMHVTTPTAANKAPQQLSSFDRNNKKAISRRERFYKAYFETTELERARQRPPKEIPRAERRLTSIRQRGERERDEQVDRLVAKARARWAESDRQRAILKAAADEVAREKAEKEAAERAVAEKAAAEQAARLLAEREKARLRAAEEEARVEAEREEARLRAAEEDARIDAEQEAARLDFERVQKLIRAAEESARAELEAERLHGFIFEPSEDLSDKLQSSLEGAGERKQIVQVGSVPLTAVSFNRILASHNGTDSWLDDDAVNAWYLAIVDAKNRTAGYVKSNSSVPNCAALNTGWWSKAGKDGVAGLSRWMKRNGVEGSKLLKCERLFLPINMGSHWTLLIINGTDCSIEYLDSMGGDGKMQFQVARELVKAELGQDYHAQEWVELKRNKSSMQNNMSDCGVFACFNGLAAAKGRPYKEVTAKTMPMARRMMAGVLINGGFEPDYEFS